ncbi:MAG: acyl-CoA thioesterase [Rhodothermales bacterium]
MSLEPKPVSASRCVMNEFVLPNDTNGLGNLMGGRLLHLMDICAAISSQRHANRTCVTAAVDFVEFNAPIKMGEVVVLESQINRAFNTSMEVEINVWAENPRKQTKRKANRAFYTFVAVDENGPVKVPQAVPETEDEQKRYDNASRRREIRLLMSGRIPLEEAEIIKSDVWDVLRREKTKADLA